MTNLAQHSQGLTEKGAKRALQQALEEGTTGSTSRGWPDARKLGQSRLARRSQVGHASVEGEGPQGPKRRRLSIQEALTLC